MVFKVNTGDERRTASLSGVTQEGSVRETTSLFEATQVRNEWF